MASYRDYLTITNPNSMDMKELRKAVSTMAAVANKRLKRMEGAPTPIMFGREQGANTISGVNKFGVKGKTDDEVIREFKRVRGFLSQEQSSLTGMKKVLKEFKETIHKRVKQKRMSRKDKRDYEKMVKQKASAGMGKPIGKSIWEELSDWRKTWDYYNKMVDSNDYIPDARDSNQVKEIVMTMVNDQIVYEWSEEETYKRILEAVKEDYEQSQEKKKAEDENDVSTSSLISMGSSD